MSSTSKFLERFDANPPSSRVAIEEFEGTAGVQLPEEYREFLLHADGGEGLIGTEAYIILWRIEELRSMNEAYEVERNAPGIVLFGSDGGGEAYGFDFQAQGVPVVAVPFVGMHRSVIRMEAQGFTAFLEKLFQS